MCQFLKGYSDQLFSLEEEKENMAVLENRDLGQISLGTSNILACAGHVSGRVAMLKCQAPSQHFSVGCARETAECPQWEHSHTLLLGMYNSSLLALKEVWSSSKVPHSSGALQKLFFSPGAERHLSDGIVASGWPSCCTSACFLRTNLSSERRKPEVLMCFPFLSC